MPVKALNTLRIGEISIIQEFADDFKIHSRLVEMGVTPGVVVRMVKKSPFNGPIEVKIRSYYLSLRWKDATQIFVR